MESEGIEKDPNSVQESTNTLKVQSLSDQGFRFSQQEIERVKCIMPKHYSFVKKSIIDKVKQNITLAPKERKIVGNLKYYQKKVSSLEELPVSNQPFVYPDLQNVIYHKNDQPELFAEVTSGYFTKLRREEKKQEKPKKEPKVQIKKPPLTPEEEVALINRKRDEQVAKLIVTKVYPPGPLPKLNIRKYIQEQAKKREKKRQQKLQQIQVKEQQRQEISEFEKQKTEAMKKALKKWVPKTEKEIVQNLISQFLNNPKYTYLSEAKTKPSMQFFERLILTKKNTNYPLDTFRNDLSLIFKIYRNTSGEEAAIIREVDNFETEFMRKIQQVKEQLIKKKKYKKATQENKSSLQPSHLESHEKLNISNRGRIRKNLFIEFNTSKKQTKKSRVSRHHNREVLGKNLLQIPKQYLQQFVLKFGSQSTERNRGRASLFEFDLNHIPSEQLYQMQQYIRKVFQNHSLPYKDLSEQQLSSDFFISDDQN